MIVDLPDTTTSQVSKTLVKIREDGGVVALGRVLTLVIATTPDAEEEAIEAANDASREHPMRVIVVSTEPGTEQGEARFSPQEVIVTTAGRDLRPLDLVPLTPGFGEQRLQQRSQQSALYVFDGTLDVWQSQLVVTVQGVRSDAWGATGGPLSRLDRERTLVRGRAAQSAPSRATSTPRP